VTGRAERLAAGLAKGFADGGVDVQVTRVATLVGVHFGPSAPNDYDEARHTDEAQYAQWFHRMLDGGVAVAPGAYEVLFPGWAHTDEIIDSVVATAADVAASLASG
jgi:glutamate-1-semialdehyde 2,1-aminomutase